MQPFWLGKKVYHEAVLMFSRDGKPAAGQLLFQPSRIISVQDYGWVTNYIEGRDYHRCGSDFDLYRVLPHAPGAGGRPAQG